MKSIKIWIDHYYDADHLSDGQMIELIPKYDNVVTMTEKSAVVGNIALLLVGLQFWEERVVKQKLGHDLSVDVDDQIKRLVKMVAGLNLDIWRVNLVDEHPDTDWIASMMDYEPGVGYGYDEVQQLGFIDLYQSREAMTGDADLLIKNVQRHGNDQTDILMADLVLSAIKLQQTSNNN